MWLAAWPPYPQTSSNSTSAWSTDKWRSWVFTLESVWAPNSALWGPTRRVCMSFWRQPGRRVSKGRFNLATNPKRADLATLLYLALLYTLLPFTLVAAGAEALGAAFWPRPDATFWSGVAPVAAQLLLLGVWLRRRWRRAAPSLGGRSGGVVPGAAACRS